MTKELTKRQKVGIALLISTAVAASMLTIIPDAVIEKRSEGTWKTGIGPVYFSASGYVITLKVHYFVPLMIAGTVGFLLLVVSSSKKPTGTSK